MQRLLDVYTVTAGDVALAYAGRGFNVRLGQWLTCSGTNLGTSRWSGGRLLDADIIVHDAITKGFKPGVLVMAFVLYDPSHPELAVPWFGGTTSRSHLLTWAGERSLGCGFFWRIHAGGLVAGDIVTMGVGYAAK